MKKTILFGEFEDEEIFIEAERDDLLENDELSPVEEAFLRGYDEAG